jgi:hypothetical protein
MSKSTTDTAPILAFDHHPSGIRHGLPLNLARKAVASPWARIKSLAGGMSGERPNPVTIDPAWMDGEQRKRETRGYRS